MSLGLLVLRVALGATLAAHGAQKVFGWFGGGGPRATAGFFGQMGFRPAYPMAVLAGLSELVGGVLVALGLLTPLGALALVVVMVVAIGTVHLPAGFFAQSGGYEFNVLIVAAAVALAGTGPGRYSLDHAFGWADDLSGIWWCVGVLAAGLVLGLGTLALRRPSEVPATEESQVAA